MTNRRIALLLATALTVWAAATACGVKHSDDADGSPTTASGTTGENPCDTGSSRCVSAAMENNQVTFVIDTTNNTYTLESGYDPRPGLSCSSYPESEEASIDTNVPETTFTSVIGASYANDTYAQVGKGIWITFTYNDTDAGVSVAAAINISDEEAQAYLDSDAFQPE